VTRPCDGLAVEQKPIRCFKILVVCEGDMCIDHYATGMNLLNIASQ
jgi:hypothetical protein